MSAYYSADLSTLIESHAESIVGQLSSRLIAHYSGDHRKQLVAWTTQVTCLQEASRAVAVADPRCLSWGILFEFPILRLQQRLDTVLLAGQSIAVIEFKVGAGHYSAIDIRQTEDYALDLADFHAGCRQQRIIPILVATDAPSAPTEREADRGVCATQMANAETLRDTFLWLLEIQETHHETQRARVEWERASYAPVPTIVQAAELLYAGHEVREIASASSDPDNLIATTDRLIEMVERARKDRKRVVCFVTGVPGSGKTLTGLNAVHDQRFRSAGEGSGAFLSGNPPLVEVLREALAKDEKRRTDKPLHETRRVVRTEIQLLTKFLEEYTAAKPDAVPHEHVIVYDEAQRAWDAEFGKTRFGREASEPKLFLEIMGRHPDWAAIIALVGGGQEINKGEGGLSEWGKALELALTEELNHPWEVLAAPDLDVGGSGSAGQTLFPPGHAYGGPIAFDKALHLNVSVRSYRCEQVNGWVEAVLDGSAADARQIAESVGDFPVFVTRSLNSLRTFLVQKTRGNRRSGLVASSGARRLRAEGLGVSLSTNDLKAVCDWYLQPKDDVRSSNALEVTANEYTCQGLEVDHVGVCWGGDFLWDEATIGWAYRRFSGSQWMAVRSEAGRQIVRNKYRVLLTRARVGMAIWVPQGSKEDATRDPDAFQCMATYLAECGASPLEGTRAEPLS